MNREFPDRLKIGGHLVRIELVDIEDNGDSDLEKCRIRINKNLPRTQQEATLIHEIFHFLNTTMDDDTLGHAFLDGTSEQLYQVLKDNDLLKL